MSQAVEQDVTEALAGQGYLADRALATSLRLALALDQPLLLEGEAGVGKTEVARALATARDARLIRLQCHEGIDLHHAVYDWDYPRQLLAIRAAESGVEEGDLFSRRFLVQRPLLEALEHDGPAVLLIDEIDRADDEFEAFLLEFLADFAVTIPELGTITAKHKPTVVLTSNRTRELHDALKRRCLYHWIDYPDPEREHEIVLARVPGVPDEIAWRVVNAVAKLRGEELYKSPGVGETIVWARALLALDGDGSLEDTLGVALKVHEDLVRVRERGVLERPVTPASPTPRLSALVGALRARDVRAGVGELLAAHRAVAAVDATDREDVRLALRAVFCSRHEDLEAFDEAFVEVFGTGEVPRAPNPLEELGELVREALPRHAMPSNRPGAQTDEEPEPVPAAYSDVELLRRKDFADMTDEELAAANRILALLALRGPTRRSRRMRASRRRAHRPDLRRTLRSSLRHGGEPLERRWRGPTVKPRPVVLVLDVSGSMTPYARAMMQYLHASVAARRRVEAFAFGTRLTRITRELAGRDHDEALRRATAAVVDFSGGTRIGASIAELNRTHGRRLGRGAVVIILSDGWDRGEPEVLAAEMERLRRSAYRVVWLNPLAAHPEYAPLTRGMQAALPYTDHLLAGNSIASLEDLATILEDV